MSMIGYKMLYTDLRSIWFHYPYELDKIHVQQGLPIVYTNGFHFYDTAAAIPGMDDYLKSAGGFVLAKVEALGDIVSEVRKIPPSNDEYRVYCTNKIRIVGVQSSDMSTEMYSYYEADLLNKKFMVADYVQEIKRNVSMFYPSFADHFFVRPEDSAFDDESYARKATYPNVLYMNASELIEGPDGKDNPIRTLTIGHPDTLTEEQKEEEIEIGGILLPNWNDPPIPPEPPVIIPDVLTITNSDGEQVIGETLESGIRRFTISESGEYTVFGGTSSEYAQWAQIYVTASTSTLTIRQLFIDNKTANLGEFGVIEYADTAISGSVIVGGQTSIRLPRGNNVFAIGSYSNTNLLISGYTGVIQVRDTNKCGYGIYTNGTITVNSTVAFDINTENSCIYGSSIACNTSTTYLLRSRNIGIEVKNGKLTVDSGAVIQILEANVAGIYVPTSFTMYGGTITITGIYGDGIRAEKAYVYDGKINISTAYQYAAKNLYIDDGSGKYNTRVEVDNTVTESIRVNPGSHVPIYIGTREYQYIYESVEPGTGHIANTLYTQSGSGELKITGGKITLDTSATGISYVIHNTRIIYGAPSDALVLNGSGEITGGTLSITSSLAAIHNFGSLTLSKKANVTTYFANNAIKGKATTIGTPSTGFTPFFAAATYEDCIRTCNESDYYIFTDESRSTYIKTTTISSSGAFFAVREALFTANLFLGTREVTVTGGGTVHVERTGEGSVINATGSIYFYTGLSYLYGTLITPTIKYTGKLVLGKGSTLMLFGTAIERPNTKNQPYIWLPINTPDGAAIIIKDSNDNAIASTIPPVPSSYLLVTAPSMENTKRYSIYQEEELLDSVGAIL